MRHSRLAGFFMAIGVRAVLDLVSGGRAAPAAGTVRAAPRRAGAAPRAPAGETPGRPAGAVPAPAGETPGRPGRAVPALAGETPARPGRAVPALALLAVGAVTMLVFESTVTRIIGVLALFGFVIAGVFAIADPRWLGASPALGHGDDRARSAGEPSR
jgi:hypothetical protein